MDKLIDLQGIEIQPGDICIIPGEATNILIVRYSHQSAFNFIFKSINIGKASINVRTYKRQYSKQLHMYSSQFDKRFCIKASQELIDNLEIT